MTIDELRGTFLFEAFSADQLRWVLDRAEEDRRPAGATLVTEGEPAEAFWVLLDGEIEILRKVAGRDTVMGTGTAPGTWAGWLPVFDRASVVTARTLRPSRFVRLPREAMRELLTGGFPITTHLLAGVTYGVQNFEAIARQQEKLAALGKLSAGLAHELNNPAAAARRAADRLPAALQERDERALALGRALDPDQVARVAALAHDCAGRAAAVVGLGPLERSDREDALAAWLDLRGVADADDLAPALVDAGLDPSDLEKLAADLPVETLPAALAWLGAALAADALANEIEQSIARLSDLVRAIKDYTYLDRAPEQEVDLRDGIETTLRILAYKLRGVTVERDYAPDLPRVTAYASALNQVWTNLLVNAIEALRDAGTPDPCIRIRTARDGDGVLVEIADNGPGIPAEVQPRVLEPFFTTKPVGEGTGLGLDTAYRVVVRDHHGDLRLTSRPGDTRFAVRLPADGVKPRDGIGPVAEDPSAD